MNSAVHISTNRSASRSSRSPRLPARFFLIQAGIYFTTLLGALLGLRLIDLQLIRGSSFLHQAEDNRTFSLHLTAPRGVFLDRYGDNLVLNKKKYTDVANISLLFSQEVPISRNEALIKMASASSSVNYQLQRSYLYATALAHSLGYIALPTAEDLLSNQFLSTHDSIGKMGLEKVFNQQLAGQPGKKVYEINTLGEKQKLISDQLPMSGQAITTTIDPYLSQVAFAALIGQEFAVEASASGQELSLPSVTQTGRKGVVLIADASNGEILTIVSSPSFDANDLSNVLVDEAAEQQRQVRVQQYFANPDKVFFNRAVSGAYPPGSVFKLVTAISALENQAITANTTVLDEGILKVGNFEYANWYFTQYGRTDGEISLVRAIARSNDIFFYKASEFVGPEKLAQTARDFGFGQKTNIELTAERAGLVPDPAWKEQTIGEKWFLGNTYHFGIGQGDILVTPVQILQMVQALANHGSLCPPSLKKKQVNDCRGLSIKEENLALVLQGMIDVCSQGGTAFPFFTYNQWMQANLASQSIAPEADQEADQELTINTSSPDFQLSKGVVACKTGTAEFGAADNRGYRKTHGWFVAIVGTDKLLAELMAQREQFASGAATVVAAGSASGSAAVAPSTSSLRDQWLSKLTANNFPKSLVFVVLVESDDQTPYQEGSTNASPIVKQLIEWMWGRKL